ncbi:hypothetical protein [Blautia intestinalis]|uniref:hypothetical protein n=1 Tax=Blautia intestinalis TaxID=2763028 RepID=UPI0022DE9E0D|nr:hypothetical protein [Blautia intestinalis]
MKKKYSVMQISLSDILSHLEPQITEALRKMQHEQELQEKEERERLEHQQQINLSAFKTSLSMFNSPDNVASFFEHCTDKYINSIKMNHPMILRSFNLYSIHNLVNENYCNWSLDPVSESDNTYTHIILYSYVITQFGYEYETIQRIIFEFYYYACDIKHGGFYIENCPYIYLSNLQCRSFISAFPKQTIMSIVDFCKNV